MDGLHPPYYHYITPKFAMPSEFMKNLFMTLLHRFSSPRLPWMFILIFQIYATADFHDKMSSTDQQNNRAIFGFVVDKISRNPIPEAIVEAISSNGIEAATYTDETGMYAFVGLKLLPHLVRVRTSDYQDGIRYAHLYANESLQVDFALVGPCGRLTGTAVDATERPVIGATVHLIEEGFPIGSVQTDHEGIFIFENIRPGSYQICAGATDFGTVTRDVNIISDQSTAVDLCLFPICINQGQIVHSITGKPVKDISVEVWQNGFLLSVSNSDENGIVNFKGLGLCRIILKAPNIVTLIQEIRIKSSNEIMNFYIATEKPKPPGRATGKVISKKTRKGINRIYSIKWHSNDDSSVVSYRIYREGKAIGQVDSGNPLVYNDEWRGKKAKTYQITAANAYDQESEPVTVTFP